MATVDGVWNESEYGNTVIQTLFIGSVHLLFLFLCCPILFERIPISNSILISA